MAVMERLALIIDADGKGAVRELENVGRAAERNLGRAEDRADRWAQKFTSVGTKMVATSAVIGAGLWNASQASSDLNEAISQTDQVFGSAADKIGVFAENAAGIGQSERAAREAANTFGLFFEKADLSGDAAADMSITMTKLASDMASFKNTTPDEAIEALGAALRGESEPIRRYGVLLDDATLKQRAFDMGLVRSTSGTLPPAIKMQAAYAEILAQTSTIQGDFVRTADGAANAQRVAAAEFENAKASIGEGFVPVMQALVSVGGSAASTFKGLNDDTGGFASKVVAAGTVVTGFGGVLAVGAGKAMELRKALIAAAADGSKAAAVLQASWAPLIAITAAVTGGLAVWNAAMERGERQATNLGIQMDNALLSADPEKLRRMAGTLRTSLDDLNNESDGWNPFDSDYRETMKMGAAEVERAIEAQTRLENQMVRVAEATGNSEANVLGWLQAQEAAGIVYTSSTGALDAYRRAVEQSGVAVDTATADQLELAEEIGDTEKAIDDAIKAIDKFFGKLDSPGDLTAQWEASMDGLQSALQENGLGWNYVTGEMDLSTEAGRANREAMKEARDAAVDLGQAIIDGGGSVEDATAKTLNYAGNLRQMMAQAGYSEAAINSMLAELGLTPEQVATAFQQPGLAEAQANLADYTAKLAALPQIKETFISVKTGLFNMLGIRPDGERAAGGPVAAGGTYLVGERGPELVTMPGNGTVHSAGATARMLSGGPDVIEVTSVVKLDDRVLGEAVTRHLAADRRSHAGSRRIEY